MKKFFALCLALLIIGTASGAFASMTITGNFEDGMVGDNYGRYSKRGNIKITGRSSYSYLRVSVVDGEIPKGLTFEQPGPWDYFYFNGTATKKGTYTFTLMVTDTVSDAGSATKEFTMTIADNPNLPSPTLSGNFSDITLNNPFTKALYASDGTAPYTWSYTGQIPTGLRFRGSDTDTTGSTFTLSGTPTEKGTYNFTVTVTDLYEKTATKDFSVVVAEEQININITTSSLPDATAGVYYSQTLSANPSGVTWSASGLPSWLSINSSTGTLSGTPTGTGNFPFSVTATQGTAQATKQFTLRVVNPNNPDNPDNPDNPVSTINITKTTLANGTVNTAYNDTLAADVSGVTWSVSSGALPTGLTLNASTGAITGTPASAGTFTFTVRATRGTAEATREYTIIIVGNSGYDDEAINITTPEQLPNVTVGHAYSATFTADKTGVTWSSEKLPDGLSLSNAGVLSGTPSLAGSFLFTVTAQSGEEKAVKNFTLYVLDANGGSVTNLTNYDYSNHNTTNNTNIDNDGRSLFGGVSTGGCNLSSFGLLLALMALKKFHR